MTKTLIIAFGLAALAYANARRPNKITPAWFQRLSRGQKIFGVVAFVLTFVVVLNPEFLALGLLGDTAFFEVLVFALTLQMHALAAQAFRRGGALLLGGARRLEIPSRGLCYLLAVSLVASKEAVSAFSKVGHRIFS